MSLNATIAELLLEKGRLKGQGAAASGQVWGSALANIGQDVAQTIKEAPARADEARARAARDHFAKLLRDTPPIEQNGLKLTDIPAIQQGMNAGGFGPEAAPAMQHLDAVNQATMQFQDARKNLVKSYAVGAIAAGGDPGLAKQAIAQMRGNQVYSDQTLDGWDTRIEQHPEDTMKILQYIAGPEKTTVVPEGAKLVGDTSGNVVATGAPKHTVINGQLVDDSTGAPVGAAIPPQETPEAKALKQAQLAEINAKLNGTLPISPKDRADLQIQRDRLNAEVQHWKDTDEGAPVLTDEAKRIAAQQWAMTGQMVPAGMGKAGTKMRADIMNEAAEIYKGLDLPSQQAAYQANKASLIRTQGTLDNLTSFEKAAGKNLDMFIDLSKNIPDSGVPWLNTPIRLLSDKMVGNEYLPAIQAARKIATREVARVVNVPGLRGELTDSAREGVDGMMSGDITIAQMKRVAPVFKTDMSNVHTSLSEQLRDIQSRIATPPGETPKSAPTKAPDTLLPGFSIQRGGQ